MRLDFECMPHGVALRVTRPRVAALSAVHRHPHVDTDPLTTAGLGGIQPTGSLARYESRVGGHTPCLTATDDHGFTVDEAAVVHRVEPRLLHIPVPPHRSTRRDSRA